MKKLVTILFCVLLLYSCTGGTENNNDDSSIELNVIAFVDKESNIYVHISSINQDTWKKLDQEQNMYKDSILDEDGMEAEYTLRDNISKKYFNLDKILEVYIYNYKSDMLGSARYVKTVYYSDVIAGYYCHVFKPLDIRSINPETRNSSKERKLKNAYFISNSLSKHNNMEVKEYTNTDLDNILVLEYIRGSDKYEISHFQLLDGSNTTIYSKVSICDPDNNFSKSYITETKNGKTNILHSISDCIWDAIPTKIFIKNKPVFVGTSGLWEYYPGIWGLE